LRPRRSNFLAKLLNLRPRDAPSHHDALTRCALGRGALHTPNPSPHHNVIGRPRTPAFRRPLRRLPPTPCRVPAEQEFRVETPAACQRNVVAACAHSNSGDGIPRCAFTDSAYRRGASPAFWAREATSGSVGKFVVVNRPALYDFCRFRRSSHALGTSHG